MENYQLDAWEKHAKSIKKENAKLTPNLKIRGMRWLKRTNRKKFGPLIIEVDSAEQANRLIIEEIVLGYDLKQVERYDAGCRITQCFKCQKYGYISSICSNKETCGYYGEDYNIETCVDISPASRRRCAACYEGQYIL
jgi:hypothetical protein